MNKKGLSYITLVGVFAFLLSGSVVINPARAEYDYRNNDFYNNRNYDYDWRQESRLPEEFRRQQELLNQENFRRQEEYRRQQERLSQGELRRQEEYRRQQELRQEQWRRENHH